MQPYRSYLYEKAKEVLETIPRPFGTFEKAKYILCKFISGEYIYQFTTTVRGENECIEIMKTIFENRIYVDEFFRVIKFKNGQSKTIYTNKIHTA